MSLEPERGAFVFFSYAHRDKWLRDRLEDHLSNLRYRGLITTWHDREIRAGDEWTRQIDIYLNKAHIILLLISSHFMASEYCYSREMKQALERHERREADVIPILLRSVHFTGATFAKLQMLPTNGKPVMRWRDQDSAFFDIACGIERVAQKYSAQAPPSGWHETAWPHIEPITHHRVFLSAAPADADLADRLAADLKSRDIVVWTEQHTPDNSQTTTEEGIRQAIRAAQAVVLVVSSQTRSSHTVKEHLRLAELYQQRLILAWVGDDEHVTAPPLGWRETGCHPELCVK